MERVELLERNLALDLLERHLTDAAAGHGRLVLMGGEAGVGKSALVTSFYQAHATSVRSLIGLCDPLATPRPLGPLVDIATALGGPLEGLIQSGARREQLLTTFLTEMSARPTIAVFEDLHWADEATLDLLRFFERRVGRTRALAIGTYRDDGLGAQHPLSLTIGDLATAQDVVRLSLQPLSEEAVRSLARGKHPDAASLYRVTGGNPFFVTEVLAANLQGIPKTVRDAVLARAARLSPAARATLDAAAVLGSHVESTLLARMPEVTANGIDECVETGMLQRQNAALQFRHELARMALYEAIAHERRTALHRKALDLIRERSGGALDLASLAHHAEEARDQESVLAFAPAAAREASRLGAHREAAEQYARALRFSGNSSAEVRASLFEERSYECYLTDQEQEAISARESAVDLWRRLDQPLKLGENLRWLSRLYWLAGQTGRAHAVADEAQQMLEKLPPGPQLAWAYSNLSQLYMVAMEHEPAIAWGEKARILGENLGEPAIVAHALNNIGSSIGGAGYEGRAELERSLQLSLDAGLEEQAARAYANLHCIAIQRRQFADAHAYFERAEPYYLERDLDTWRTHLLAYQGLMLLHEGRWSEAVDTVAEVLNRPNVWHLNRLLALLVVGWVRARRGDPEDEALLDAVLELGEPRGELEYLGPIRIARAETAWIRGDRARALAEAQQGFALTEGRSDVWLTAELAVWLYRLAGGAPPVKQIPEPFALEMSGDVKAASEAWKTLGCPFDAALVLARADDESGWREAQAVFDSMGARPASLMVQRQLRSAGMKGVPRGPRATTRSNPFNLTEREMEVLDLVVVGLRNSDIAERLFLTPKTVDHHVSSILSKLGVQSRRHAAQLAKDRELFTAT